MSLAGLKLTLLTLTLVVVVDCDDVNPLSLNLGASHTPSSTSLLAFTGLQNTDIELAQLVHSFWEPKGFSRVI